MTRADSPVQEDRARVPLKTWSAVLTVSLGIFLLVTAEQLPIGLLTPVATDLDVSVGTAGVMVTVPGVVAAISAPLVPVVVGRLDRRVLLVVLMALMTAASALSAVAPNFAVLLASRVLVGVTIGGFWAIAGGLAVRLVPAHAVTRATAVIFGGVAAANVFGVPLGTLIGSATGWRTAFIALGVLALLVLVGLFLLLPGLPPDRPVRVGELVAQLRDPGVRAGIVATFLIVSGHLAAFTYVSPLLQRISGLGEGVVGALLFGFGAAGFIGNFIAGAAVARGVRRTVLVITVSLAAVMLLFPVLGRGPVGGIALLLLWGLAYGGVSVTLQTWMFKAAPDAVEAATSLWVAVFNFSIALGALVGGVVVDRVALPAVLVLGGVLVLVTLLALWGARRARFA
ncbi:MFS transporter [Saccharothrix sp. HUAS TT1]|uniref:MFS transporter n=1 Tax=unclassified Saccharothrix TaxID=2593673 RepID=UPI00345C457E